MNILLVNSYYGYNTNGGAEKVCRTIANEFVKRGNNVSVLSVDSYAHIEDVQGVKVFYIKTFIGKNRNKNRNLIIRVLLKFFRAYSFFDYFKFARIIKKGAFDVINTHSIEDISPVIWKVAHDCNIKIVHTIHDRYLQCYKLFMLKDNGELCNTPSFLCKIRKTLYSSFYKMVDMYVSPSKMFSEGTFANCSIIYNGVKAPVIEDREKMIIDREREHIILYAGNLNRHKGIFVLIDAFRKLDSRWKLYIAGDGELYDEVNVKIKDIDNVCMLGRLNEKELSEMYKRAYVFVIPSIWKENCPMVILEAFSYGVPVIGSNIGGNVELVEEGVTGYLFESGNCDDLAKKIDDLEINYERIADNLKVFKYSLDKQVEEYLNLYTLLIYKNE